MEQMVHMGYVYLQEQAQGGVSRLGGKMLPAPWRWACCTAWIACCAAAFSSRSLFEPQAFALGCRGQRALPPARPPALDMPCRFAGRWLAHCYCGNAALFWQGAVMGASLEAA